MNVIESGLRAIAYGGILHMKEWAAEHYPEAVDCDHVESMRIHIARKCIELLTPFKDIEKEGWRALGDTEIIQYGDVLCLEDGDKIQAICFVSIPVSIATRKGSRVEEVLREILKEWRVLGDDEIMEEGDIVCNHKDCDDGEKWEAGGWAGKPAKSLAGYKTGTVEKVIRKIKE